MNDPHVNSSASFKEYHAELQNYLKARERLPEEDEDVFYARRRHQKFKLRTLCIRMINSSALIKEYHTVLQSYVRDCFRLPEEIGRIFTARRKNQKIKLEELSKEMLRVANSDDIEIWYSLGEAHLNAWGLESCSEQTGRWLLMAAKAGHRKAMVKYAKYCLQRFSYSNDSQEEAAKWLSKAADLGDASGIYWLASALEVGRGLEANPSEAIRLYTKLIDAGDNRYIVTIGRIHAYDLKNPQEGIRWLEKAADLGNEDSFRLLASIYGDMASEVFDANKAGYYDQKAEAAATARRAKKQLGYTLKTASSS